MSDLLHTNSSPTRWVQFGMGKRAQVRIHNQQMISAESAVADKDTFGHLSFRILIRRQSLAVADRIKLRFHIAFHVSDLAFALLFFMTNLDAVR